jgi:hypothetical protein
VKRKLPQSSFWGKKGYELLHDVSRFARCHSVRRVTIVGVAEPDRTPTLPVAKPPQDRLPLWVTQVPSSVAR